MRKELKRMAVVGAAGVTALLMSSTNAFATGDWSAQLGQPGSGCFGYSLFGNGYVSGNVYQQGDDHCAVQLIERDSSGRFIQRTLWSNTEEAGMTASTVSWSFGGGSCIEIIVEDYATGTTANVTYC